MVDQSDDKVVVVIIARSKLLTAHIIQNIFSELNASGDSYTFQDGILVCELIKFRSHVSFYLEDIRKHIENAFGVGEHVGL